MLATPALHPRDVLRPADVVLFLGFVEPPLLTGRLARLTARGLGAIPLVFHIARVRPEQRSATQALTLSLAFHGPAPLVPIMRRHRRAPSMAHPRRTRQTREGNDRKKRRRYEEEPGLR